MPYTTTIGSILTKDNNLLLQPNSRFNFNLPYRIDSNISSKAIAKARANTNIKSSTNTNSNK